MQLIKNLIASLEGVSIAKPQKKTKSASAKMEEANLDKLEKVCGAWSGNGRSSDEDIELIYGGRQQGTTRNPVEL